MADIPGVQTNIPNADMSRDTAQSMRAEDYNPHEFARMRRILVTQTPQRLNDLLGPPTDADRIGPTEGVTKCRLWVRGKDPLLPETFFLKRDPRATMNQAQFLFHGEFLRIGCGTCEEVDADMYTLILQDNPWLMMVPQMAPYMPYYYSGYEYGDNTPVLVEEL